MKLLIPAIALLGLCSCGDGNDKSAAAPSNGAGVPSIERVTKARPMELVQRERRAMGRWRSQPGVLAGSKNQWIILDIAGTKDARLEVRSSDLGREAVTAFATGKVELSPTGVVVSLPDATGALADFKDGSASFPGTSMMLLKTANGRQFEMTYDGQ